MRPLLHVVLAAFLVAPPAVAAPAVAADGLVAAAETIARRAGITEQHDRIDLLIAVAKAHVRRKNRAAALAVLDEAERVAGREPGAARGTGLVRVAAALHAAGEQARARAMVKAATAAVAKEEMTGLRTYFGNELAEAGMAEEAEAALAGVPGAQARAALAQAWRRAGDGERAAQRAGEALALWRKLPAEQAARQAALLAADLWVAGYPTQAIEVAEKAPKSAWPHEIKPLVMAMAEEPPPAAQAKQPLAFMEVILERCNSRQHMHEMAQAILLAAAARAYLAMGSEDRPYFTLLAADSHIDEGLQAAGEAADSPEFIAARADALVAVGDGYVRIGKASEGTQRFARGERLAASLEADPAQRPTASRVHADAAVSRARAGVPNEAVKSAAAVKSPYYRGLALLRIDELAPEAAPRLSDEAREALAAALK